MQLPRIQSKLQDLMLIQDKWRSILNPFIAIPSLNTSILENVVLNNGTTVINHLLGRTLRGWRIVRLRAVAASVYDLQDQNQTPQLTLVLVSNAKVNCDLEVF